MISTGFLSDSATDLKSELIKEASKEIALAIETNNYAHSLIKELNTKQFFEDFSDPSSKEVIAASSLLRVMEQYQSIIVLCQGGFKISAQSAIRGLLESTFFMVMLRNEHTELMEYMYADDAQSRKSLAEALKKTKALTKEQNKRIESAIKKIMLDKKKHTTIMKVAQSSDISDLYPYYKYLSNMATHFTASSLSLHLAKDADKHWIGFDCGFADSTITKENLLNATKIFQISVLAYLEIRGLSSTTISSLMAKRANLENEHYNSPLKDSSDEPQ